MAKDFFGNSDEPKPKAKKKKKVSPNFGGLKHKKKRKRNPPLRSSTPKEKELLSDEERHKRRVLAAQKAAKTRKENEAKLSPEEREKLRQKRREQFLKNMEKARRTKKEKEATLTPEEKEELKKKRSEVAKKAAETRKENEAKLSPEEREELRRKRAEILKQNRERKRIKEELGELIGDVKPIIKDEHDGGSSITPEEREEFEEQLAWEKYETLVGEITQGYNVKTGQALIDIMNVGISGGYIVDYMEQVSDELANSDISIIVYADSLSEEVIAAVGRVVSILHYYATDFADTMALATEISDLLASEIYSRRYHEFKLPV